MIDLAILACAMLIGAASAPITLVLVPALAFYLGRALRGRGRSPRAYREARGAIKTSQRNSGASGPREYSRSD